MATRIMIINDDQDILDLYEAILNEEGYDVITSKLAFEHPAAVEMRRPNLVMLDLKFGTQLEGWKMMQKLRLYRPTAELPIIICTAAVREAREQEDHLRSEGIGIVYKPFAIDHLLLAVRQTLAVAEAIQAAQAAQAAQAGASRRDQGVPVPANSPKGTESK
ncbi:MAG TPA: response regulator [Ktedonobacterales bacterium]|nr:response regulator [Ktedonobacterales bacterium]